MYSYPWRDGTVNRPVRSAADHCRRCHVMERLSEGRGGGRAMRALERTGPKTEDVRRQDDGGEVRVEAMPCLRVSR